MDALLDSGASDNFLDKSIVLKYGLKTTSCEKSFILADGSTSGSSSELSDVQVTSLVDDGTSSWTIQKFKNHEIEFLLYSWHALIGNDQARDQLGRSNTLVSGSFFKWTHLCCRFYLCSDGRSRPKILLQVL